MYNGYPNTNCQNNEFKPNIWNFKITPKSLKFDNMFITQSFHFNGHKILYQTLDNFQPCLVSQNLLEN